MTLPVRTFILTFHLKAIIDKNVKFAAVQAHDEWVDLSFLRTPKVAEKMKPA